MSFGAHRRDELVAIGVSVPSGEFDLYSFDRSTSLLWSWESAVCNVDLWVSGGDDVLRIRASDVRHFEMPAFSGRLFLPELEVVDLRADGLEGIRYELVSQFDRSFRLRCGDLIVAAGE